MQKFAFIENVPGLSVEPYTTTFDDGEWFNRIAGCDGIDKCLAYAKELIADGYTLFDLCGDFGPEHIAELLKDAPEGTEAYFAAYLPEELTKMEALEQYVEYGQIIMGNVDEPTWFHLTAPEMNTHSVFVRDQAMAVEAAKQLAADGVDGIELCSAFDLDMTKEIIAAVESIDPKIPVGSNGIQL